MRRRGRKKRTSRPIQYRFLSDSSLPICSSRCNDSDSSRVKPKLVYQSREVVQFKLCVISCGSNDFTTPTNRLKSARFIHGIRWNKALKNRTPEIFEENCACALSKPDCAALTKRVIFQKHLMSNIDSKLAQNRKSESVEREYAVVEYKEFRLYLFCKNRNNICVLLQQAFDICESRAIVNRRRKH